MAKKTDEPIELISGRGLRKLLAALLKGRVDKASFRIVADDLGWDFGTLRRRCLFPETITAEEQDQLLAKFKIKLFASLV